MKTYSREEFILNKEELLKKIKQGDLFIYPTDTLYGIGCNALISESVKKIRNLKNNRNQPFSVIAPSEGWIIENCGIKNKEEYLKKLPGPYTLIFNLKNKKCIAKETNSDAQTLGVRIPNHWFTKIVQESQVPIITTSVNCSGEKPIEEITEITEEFEEKLEFTIDDGIINKGASTIIILTKEDVEVIKR